MGKHFGNLQKLKGVVYYTLSPLELNPFTLMTKPGVAGLFRRIYTASLPAFIPLTLAYLVYDWGMTTYHKSQRKNPDDFKDDV